MIGALLALYPSSWRRRYESEVRALLEDTGLSMAIVFDVVRGAAAARAHALCSSLASIRRHRQLPARVRALAIPAWLLALFLFYGGWSDIYKQATFDLEWRAVIAANLMLALLAALVCLTRRWWFGILGLLSCAVALASQYGIRPVPAWVSSVGPLTVSLVGFLLFGLALLWPSRHSTTPA